MGWNKTTQGIGAHRTIYAGIKLMTWQQEHDYITALTMREFSPDDVNGRTSTRPRSISYFLTTDDVRDMTQAKRTCKRIVNRRERYAGRREARSY